MMTAYRLASDLNDDSFCAMQSLRVKLFEHSNQQCFQVSENWDATKAFDSFEQTSTSRRGIHTLERYFHAQSDGQCWNGSVAYTKMAVQVTFLWAYWFFLDKANFFETVLEDLTL